MFNAALGVSGSIDVDFSLPSFAFWVGGRGWERREEWIEGVD